MKKLFSLCLSMLLIPVFGNADQRFSESYFEHREAGNSCTFSFTRLSEGSIAGFPGSPESGVEFEFDSEDLFFHVKDMDCTFTTASILNLVWLRVEMHDNCSEELRQCDGRYLEVIDE